VAALRDWDLWGPFLLCFTLAIVLERTAPPNSEVTVFSAVFVIVALGSIFVTLNAKVLGGQCSVFQSVCVLGYCLFPLVLDAIVLEIIRIVAYHNFWLQFGLSMGAFIWATFSSVGFMASLVPPSRKWLAIYPLFLFYFVLTWLIVIQVPTE